jgi:putative membrane protein
MSLGAGASFAGHRCDFDTPPFEVHMRRLPLAAALAVSTVVVLGAVAAATLRDDPQTPAVESVESAALATPLDDATIVAIFDAANTADIETGRLAAERGQSKEVRDFGAMLARDHVFVRQQGRDLANKLGVTPTPPSDSAAAKAHAKAMARLRSIPASDFDHAFLQHEAAFHKAVIEAVTTTLLPAIENAELNDLVVKVAPAFEAHMIAAETLDKRLSGTSGK